MCGVCVYACGCICVRGVCVGCMYVCVGVYVGCVYEWDVCIHVGMYVLGVYV